MQADAEIKNYNRQIRWLFLSAVLVAFLLVLFGSLSVQRFNNVEEIWEQHNAHTIRIENTIGNINQNIGYGGFIHNFKNLVLRRDLPSYQGAIEQNILQLRKNLEALDSLLKLPEEQAVVAQVRATFDEYERNYQIAVAMIKKGKGSAEIDAVVKVSDTKAVAAIALLASNANLRATEAEKYAQAEHAAAMRFMLYSGLVVLAAISAAVLALLTFARRVVAGNRQLYNTRARLNTLLDTSPDPMISVRPDGRIVRVNLMAQQFFGYTNDEMLSMKIESLIPERFRVKHVSHCNGFFDKPKNRSMGDGDLNLQALTRDGREPFIDLSLSYSGEGADRLVTVSLRDMTEKIRVREEMAKSRAAKLKTIDSMTAGIAHDFNNILGSMLGYSELSLVMLKQGLHEKVIAYQEEILKSGGRVKDLIKQMLTYSRMMPNTNEKNATAIILAPIVKEVISSHRADIKSGILLDFSIANYSLSTTILPSNLQLILSNLITNAREAMGDRGKIDISLSEQSLTATLCDSCHASFSGRFVKISVSDEGSGITEANLQKIFDPFFTTKNRSTSAGMGLSIVHGLVHVQGGHIIVEASAEAGTTISVLLPFADAE